MISIKEGLFYLDGKFKWIRPNMNLYHINKNCENIISISNSGDLAFDFYKYATNFFDAAECVIHYLGEDASEKQDIAKLDLWYFAMVYLYRQSLELIVKANIFQVITANAAKKDIVGEIRHDLKEGFEKILELKNLTINENDDAKWLINF